MISFLKNNFKVSEDKKCTENYHFNMTVFNSSLVSSQTNKQTYQQPNFSKRVSLTSQLII